MEPISNVRAIFQKLSTDILLLSLYKALSQKSSGKFLTIIGVKCDKKDWAILKKCKEWIDGFASGDSPMEA